jgi:hypothetical protein
MPKLKHKENLELYIQDNIIGINEKISNFKKKSCPNAIYDETHIKNFLKNKLYNELPEKAPLLLAKFEEYSFTKSKIKDIANEFIYYHADLEKCFDVLLFKELKSLYCPKLCEKVSATILDYAGFDNHKKRYLQAPLKRIIEKTILIALQNGFLNNINNIESGIMTANAGDSAQFLFLSRAILAVYNCSNVDVRSSRYDAIIDFKNHLFKVQVKGISDNTISFKDRDRGGRGIDTTNERNQGKRITSKDCDIYVAVDKQIGICYIIPMKDIDHWDNDKIKSVHVSKLEKYRENWSIINTLI